MLSCACACGERRRADQAATGRAENEMLQSHRVPPFVCAGAAVTHRSCSRRRMPRVHSPAEPSGPRRKLPDVHHQTGKATP